MKDPTRITPLMRLLQEAWEGQPELGFAELFARLGARGIARNSSDEELRAALEAELAVHPNSFEPMAGGGGASGAEQDAGKSGAAEAGRGARLARVELLAPGTGSTGTAGRGGASSGARVATIGGGWVVLRPATPPWADSGAAGARRNSPRRSQRNSPRRKASPRGPEALLQPVAWQYEAVLRCRPGEPLRVRSTEGTEHRLGIVRRITILDQEPAGTRSPLALSNSSEAQDLSGLKLSDLGSREFLLSFDSGATVLVGRRLWVTRVARREVAHEFLRWEKLGSAEIGSPLHYSPPLGEGTGQAGEHSLEDLGPITRILPL